MGATSPYIGSNILLARASSCSLERAMRMQRPKSLPIWFGGIFEVYGCFHKLGVPFVGVSITRALLFGRCFKAPDFGTLPYGTVATLRVWDHDIGHYGSPYSPGSPIWLNQDIWLKLSSDPYYDLSYIPEVCNIGLSGSKHLSGPGSRPVVRKVLRDGLTTCKGGEGSCSLSKMPKVDGNNFYKHPAGF